MKFTTKDLIYIGLLSAICAIATTVLIPLPGGAMVHLGSAALFTSSVIFGGIYGGLAGAIGSGLFDLVMGHSAYTVFSIVIKGLAGLIVGALTVGLKPPAIDAPFITWKKLLAATLVGAVWTALGYFVAWGVVLNSFTAAFANLPASFLTSSIGILVALLLVPKLQHMLRRFMK